MDRLASTPRQLSCSALGKRLFPEGREERVESPVSTCQCRYSKLLLVFGALRKSLDMLILMVFFISLCIVFFATLMYYAERGTWQEALGRCPSLGVLPWFSYCTAVLHTLAPGQPRGFCLRYSEARMRLSFATLRFASYVFLPSRSLRCVQ